MGRKPGSINKVTATKHAIQDEMKTKKVRKPRVFVAKGYVSLNDNYRIRLDSNNYILERKLQAGELPITEQDEDSEEVVVAEPGWTLNGYFSINSLGLAHLLDCVCTEMQTRKFAGKTVKFEKFSAELKADREEMKKIILGITQ